MPSRHPALRPAALALAGLAAACGGPDEGPAPGAAPDPDPPTARWDQVEQFRADLAAPRHPADGKGAVQVTAAPERIVAGTRTSR